jgi:hypothetical protein
MIIYIAIVRAGFEVSLPKSQRTWLAVLYVRTTQNVEELEAKEGEIVILDEMKLRKVLNIDIFP